MIRKAFRMSVHPGRHAEYERRHRPIWRELEDTLLMHGVANYSIYLDETTGDLFGYVEIEDERQWAAIAGTDVCRRWWQFMRDVTPAHADASPVSRDLREVFHIEAGARATTISDTPRHVADDPNRDQQALLKRIQAAPTT